MCCTCSIICWSNTKRFLSVLIVFGKYFGLKNVKNFKNCAALFWRLASRVKPVACPSRELRQKVFATHWRVKVPVAKKTRNFFFNSGFLGFSWLSLATCSRVKALVARFTQKVSRLPHEWTFQLGKTLKQIFQILS